MTAVTSPAPSIATTPLFLLLPLPFSITLRGEFTTECFGPVGGSGVFFLSLIAEAPGFAALCIIVAYSTPDDGSFNAFTNSGELTYSTGLMLVSTELFSSSALKYQLIVPEITERGILIPFGIRLRSEREATTGDFFCWPYVKAITSLRPPFLNTTLLKGSIAVTIMA